MKCKKNKSNIKIYWFTIEKDKYILTNSINQVCPCFLAYLCSSHDYQGSYKLRLCSDHSWVVVGTQKYLDVLTVWLLQVLLVVLDLMAILVLLTRYSAENLFKKRIENRVWWKANTELEGSISFKVTAVTWLTVTEY